MTLQVEFELFPHIDTICLPEILDSREKNYNKDKCVVMGWGKEAFGENANEYQETLKQARLRVIDNDQCSKDVNDYGQENSIDFLKKYQVPDSVMCAGPDPTCEGDGGGSLVCQSLDDPSRYVLAGVQWSSARKISFPTDKNFLSKIEIFLPWEKNFCPFQLIVSNSGMFWPGSTVIM